MTDIYIVYLTDLYRSSGLKTKRLWLNNFESLWNINQFRDLYFPSFLKGWLTLCQSHILLITWKFEKKNFFCLQGGSNPWPYDYWPDALTSWAMFFSKLNNCHQAVNYSLHWTNKNRYPRSIRPYFWVVNIAL